MAITLKGELQRTVKITVTPEGKVTRTHTREFLVVGDARKNSDLDVAQTPGITAFDSHPNDSLATCRSITATQSKNSLEWHVVCEYSTETPDRDESDDENPLAKPVKRSFSTNKGTRIVTKDINGDPILNTAKVPFDPPIEAPCSNFVARFVRNEPSFSQRTSASFVDHVNSVAFAGLPPGTVKCNDITASEEFSKTMRYFEVTYEFEYQAAGWQPSILNQGFQGLDNGQLYRIVDRDGEPVPEPVPLDNNGTRIQPSALPGAAVYLDFEVLETADFNALGLNPY